MGLRMKLKLVLKVAFIAIICINIFLAFTFIKYKFYVYVDQYDISNGKFSTISTGLINEGYSNHTNRTFGNVTHEKIQTYLFVVRSNCKNVQLRHWIRNYLNIEYMSKINTTLKDKEKLTNKSSGVTLLQLVFVLEDVTECLKENVAREISESRDINWINNSGSKSTISVQFLKSLSQYTDVQFYIISQDTTFVNFHNVVHLLNKQGKDAFD